MVATLRAIVPEPAPRGLPERQVVAPRLASRVLFVIVDGLRYDIATDPTRMPRFSEAMKQRTSGEIWAGSVTMTTSAALAYGTGQRGGLQELVRNLDAGEPACSSWIENAARRGLRLVSVGDPAWPQMYGRFLSASRRDPEGVAIDVDFNAKTFSDARDLWATGPDFMVVQFVTPDHQGHAYGLWSARYADHIRAFDADLHRWLDEIGSDVTVVVTSDHGQADTGTHGTDTPVLRRTPIYAYGPGIRSGVHLDRPLDQVELAGLFAALFGVPGAQHSRGMTLVEWLAVPDAVRSAIVCEEVDRAHEYGRRTLADRDLLALEEVKRACAREPAADHTGAARAAIADFDRRLEQALGMGTVRNWAIVAAVVLLAALGGFVLPTDLDKRRRLFALALAAAMIGCGVGLTYGTERFAGALPNAIRATLFTAAILAMLWIAIRPRSALGLADRWPVLASILGPGALVASYSTNTQVAGYLFVAISGWAVLRPITWQKAMLFGACVALLFFPGTRPLDPFPWLARMGPAGSMLVAAGLLGVWAWTHRGSVPLRRLAALAGLLVASVALRRIAPPLVGRAAVLILALAAILGASKGRREMALLFGAATFAWVSRDMEILTLVPTLIVADMLGRSLGEREARTGEIVLVGGLVFALVFVQRVGIQGGLEAMAMDFGAGAFGDPHVPKWLVGSALVIKYFVAEALLIGAVVSQLRERCRPKLLGWLGAAQLARTASALLIFYVCGKSYWTAHRTLGDLPFGPLGALVVVALWMGISAGGAASRAASRNEAPARL